MMEVIEVRPSPVPSGPAGGDAAPREGLVPLQRQPRGPADLRAGPPFAALRSVQTQVLLLSVKCYLLNALQLLIISRQIRITFESLQAPYTSTGIWRLAAW